MDSSLRYPYEEPRPDDEREEPKSLVRRFPRARYRATAAGAAMLETYQQAMKLAHQNGSGGVAIEAVQAAWATERGLGPRDGLVLEELVAGPSTLLEMSRSLQECGLDRKAIEESVERLAGLGLVEVAVRTRGLAR